jgi:hypothetical protein
MFVYNVMNLVCVVNKEDASSTTTHGLLQDSYSVFLFIVSEQPRQGITHQVYALLLGNIPINQPRGRRELKMLNTTPLACSNQLILVFQSIKSLGSPVDGVQNISIRILNLDTQGAWCRSLFPLASRGNTISNRSIQQTRRRHHFRRRETRLFHFSQVLHVVGDLFQYPLPRTTDSVGNGINLGQNIWGARYRLLWNCCRWKGSRLFFQRQQTFFSTKQRHLECWVV